MSDITEAIIFFKNDEVVKEMFYTEFEAVLDDVVGIPDFANQKIQAAFVKINPELYVLGAVFFLLDFTRSAERRGGEGCCGAGGGRWWP